MALPGVEAAVVDADGEPVVGRRGLLTLRAPWPAMLRTLHGDDERYADSYFGRFGNDTYLVGDAAIMDEDGYIRVLGRVDDVINVSGHRLSTAEVEAAIASHPRVVEAAVVAQADALTGQAIAAFVTVEGDGCDALAAELRAHVAQRIGKLARPSRIVWADELPKTRSGKIMRRLLRDLADGREAGDTTTLRDPAVLDAISRALAPSPSG
jgi:acetyl-CoA synthetase